MTTGTSTKHKRRRIGDTDDGMVSLDVLDCKICYDPLTIPVYQCKNGHAVCKICRRKLEKKCPSCKLKINSRCRPLEEMIESVKVKCKNWDYGCQELLSYGNNRDDHEKTCIYAKYLCHKPACKFKEVGLLKEVSFLVAQSADLSRSNQELSEKLSRREAELSALNDELASLKQSRGELQRINEDTSSVLARVKDELEVQVATSEYAMGLITSVLALGVRLWNFKKSSTG